MKKSLVFLALVMVLALTMNACGKKSASNDETASGGNSSANGTAAQKDDENDEVTFTTDGDLVVFTASPEFKLEDSTAWLGVIPTGTRYEKEADADDADMVYCYVANFDDEKKTNYRFEFEKDYFFGVGDGTYDMVLNSSDDGAIGKVLLQIGIEIKGGKITLDYENKK